MFLFWSECGFVARKVEILVKLGVISLFGCLFNVYMKVWDVHFRMDVAKVFRLRRSKVFVMGNCGNIVVMLCVILLS